MRRQVIRFIQDETGATAIEYALFVLLISMAIITSVTNFGQAVKGMYVKIATIWP